MDKRNPKNQADVDDAHPNADTNDFLLLLFWVKTLSEILSLTELFLSQVGYLVPRLQYNEMVQLVKLPNKNMMFHHNSQLDIFHENLHFV